MTYTFDDELFSDFYKEAHGFRPRNHRFYDASPDEKQEIWDRLIVSLEASILQEKEHQRIATAKFEENIASTLLLGAMSRSQAIEWLAQPYDGSLSRMEYELNLPFNYSLR